jgi:parallel beta-helix repeat protein
MDVINIVDFGAVGDGVADDTNSILDAMFFARSQGITNVYFPSGTYMVTRGFNVDDNFVVYGDGMEKSIIKLMPDLPQRVTDLTGGSIFMGKPTFGNGDENDIRGQEFSSASNLNITIKDICFDLNRSTTNFDTTSRSYPILGAILFHNAENCLIDNVKIVNTWYWGISLQGTIDGRGCINNTISNCVIESQEWYIEKTDEVINPRQNPPLIGIQLYSYQKGLNNGSAIDLGRDNDIYVPSKVIENKIENNTITNGSHGIQLYNSSKNTVKGNKIKGCSNRGIIVTATSDENIIDANNITDIGSAGILIAYNSNGNKIINNYVKNILGVQGDGIKCSVNSNDNSVLNNEVYDFAKNGVTLLHGTIGNIVKDNKIDGGKNTTNKIGVKIIANGHDEYYVDNLTFNNQLTAKDNLCESNTISNVEIPIKVGDDVIMDTPIDNVANNIVKDNVFLGDVPQESKTDSRNKYLLIGGISILAILLIAMLKKK